MKYLARPVFLRELSTIIEGRAAHSNKDRKNSDEDDRLLIRSFKDQTYDPHLTNMVLGIKHNDRKVTRLTVRPAHDLGERAWARLGDILGQNTHVKTLSLSYCNLDMTELCAGLQANQCIEKLELSGIDLHDAENMRSLAPFLSRNPSLKDIIFQSCNLGPDSINILSNALLNRSEDSLERFNLTNNRFGDIDLDVLVLALSGSKKMTSLSLANNGIGKNGCTSLARLLENQGSNLKKLFLSRNSIDDDSAIILAHSLANNTKLRTLNLVGNDGITTRGWSAMLKLVYSNSSINYLMKSNHTLNYLGYFSAERKKTVIRALGVDNANLLLASLAMNTTSNKMLVPRRKILWSYARGNLNQGDSSIVTGAMPRIGDDSNKTNASVIKHHYPRQSLISLGLIQSNAFFGPGLAHAAEMVVSHREAELLVLAHFKQKDLR